MPTLMDGMYRYQRHIYDMTRKYYLLGRDQTIRNLDVPAGGTLLEVGCGTGRNLALAHRVLSARHSSTASIFRQEMLISARKTFETKATRPDFRVADATAFTPREFGVDGFDRILISYALSMIPDWECAIDAALAALNPRRRAAHRRFRPAGRPAGLVCASAARSWLRKFHVSPRASCGRFSRLKPLKTTHD